MRLPTHSVANVYVPSVLLAVFAALAGESASDLEAASFLPAILLGLITGFGSSTTAS